MDALTLLAIAPFAVGASAQDDLDDLLFGDDLDALLEGGAPSGEGSGAGLGVLRDWKGFVELKPRVYLEESDRGKNDGQLLLESEVELEFRFSNRLSGYFRPRMFIDAFDGELQRFEPYEVYVTYEQDGWDLRAGQLVENWGIVDTYNPIDVVNRRDFGTEPLEADRLGELGVRWRRVFEGGSTIGEPTVSVYALPVFRETRFGPEDQRLGPGTDALPFEEDQGFEPDGLDAGLYAVRLQSTLDTSLAGADLQLLFARGPARTPAFFLQGGTLLPAYYGAATVGGGFRAVPKEDAAGALLSTLTLKGEMVHTTTYSFDDAPIETPDDYLSYVFGLDRSFYGVFVDTDDITLTAEYAGESGGDDPAGLLRPFRDDLILRALYTANDFARQSLEVRALFDLDVDENVFELTYQRQLRSIHEDLQLSIQLQLFDPADPGESYFADLDELSSLAVGLRWDL